MHILSLDCFGEFTGESLVGAFAGLGITPSTFEWELGQIELGDHHLHFDREEIAGNRAVRFGVHGGMLHTDHPAQHTTNHHQHEHDDCLVGYPDLRRKLETANFSESVKSRCLGVFERIVAAVSDSAREKIDQVEFSEAEALESLLTIVLACVGLDQLQVTKIYFRQTKPASGKAVPQGAISRAILAKVSISEPVEASPLGAAILAEFDATLGAPAALKAIKSSYGLGPGDGADAVLHATLGEIG